MSILVSSACDEIMYMHVYCSAFSICTMYMYRGTCEKNSNKDYKL